MQKIILGIWLLFFWTRTFSQNDFLKLEISKLIHYDTDISFKKTPGFIIGIIDEDSTYILPFGNKIKGKKDELSATDVFEAGSITKVITAALTDILVSDGLMNYNNPINIYLPESYRNPRMNAVTLLDLINHTSGLPKRPSFFGAKEKDPRNPYAFYKTEDLLSFYRDFIPDASGFEYAHTNYALLEIAIENATGKNFGDLLDDKIFRPLSMHRSFVDFPERRVDIITKGYDRTGKETSPWTFESFKGSEGLKTTVEDLLNFIRFSLGISDNYPDLQFSQHLNNTSESTFNKYMSVSNGWQTLDLKNYTVFSHTGKTSGHTAFAAMVRETKTGVVVLSNSVNGTEDLGIQILRMVNYNWKRKPLKS